MATILCVDDDRAALATVARVLREVAPVTAAGTVGDARAALTPEVAVVVSDYRMPEVSGAVLLAEVQARDETIGRILLTAYADVEVLMEAVNRGHVHRYVAKPWDPRELRAAVSQALAAAEAERERRRLAAEIADAYARLRELDGLKSRFLTLAAHELRTPLHVLGAALEALRDLALPAEGEELLDTARRNLRWLGRSVRSMTDLARLSRPSPPRRLPLCLAVICRRAAAEVSPFCIQRRLTLHCDLPDAASGIGDPDDLHHAIMNLLLNGIRFTPDGGAIRIAVRHVAGVLDLTVADTGIGIPPPVRDRIGEPFVTAGRIDHHHSDPVAFQSGGIGLGLAVAYAIAGEHDGRIWFTSEEGKGTTFHLEIPASERENQAAASHICPPPRSSPPARGGPPIA